MKYLIMIFILSGHVIAAESDPFTVRNWHFVDVTEQLNVEVQRRMELALIKTNEVSGCRIKKLQNEMGKVLKRPIIGQVEDWVNHSNLPGNRVTLKDSIYRDSTFFQSTGLHMTEASMAPVIMLNGEIVGTDKLGHFFDEGWALYSIYRKKNNLEASLNYSEKTENGIFGMMAAGIESYADKVANFHGLTFWSDLVGEGYTSKKSPYFKCEDEHFVMIRKFDWADYVDGAWDESINCNRFRPGDFEVNVLNHIKELGMTCPVEPEKCVDAAARYGELRNHLLHPTCLQNQEKISSQSKD